MSLPFSGNNERTWSRRAMYPWGLKVAGKSRGGLFSMILPSSGPRRHLIDVCALNLSIGVCEPLAEALWTVYTGALGFTAAFFCLFSVPPFPWVLLFVVQHCQQCYGSFMLPVAPGTVHLGKAHLISVKSFDFPACPQFPSLLKSSITMRTWTHQSKNVNILVKYLSLSLNVSGNSKQKNFGYSYSQCPPRWKAVSCWVNELAWNRLPRLWTQLSLHKSTCIIMWWCVCAFLTATFILALRDRGAACDFSWISFCILAFRSTWRSE